MAAVLFRPKTFKLGATTDSSGKFDVAHGLNPKKYEILGITVAIWSEKLGSWCTIWSSDTIRNAFWWNDTNVGGYISSAEFHKQKVKIVIIAEGL